MFLDTLVLFKLPLFVNVGQLKDDKERVISTIHAIYNAVYVLSVTFNIPCLC